MVVPEVETPVCFDFFGFCIELNIFLETESDKIKLFSALCWLTVALLITLSKSYFYIIKIPWLWTWVYFLRKQCQHFGRTFFLFQGQNKDIQWKKLTANHYYIYLVQYYYYFFQMESYNRYFTNNFIIYERHEILWIRLVEFSARVIDVCDEISKFYTFLMDWLSETRLVAAQDKERGGPKLSVDIIASSRPTLVAKLSTC